jgi:hypothetical protein
VDSIAKGEKVMIVTKRRRLGMTIATLAVLLAALAAPMLAHPATARAAVSQKPLRQGLVEYALIIVLATAVDRCTDGAGKDVRPCTLEAQVSMYADGLARGRMKLVVPHREIAMVFEKAKLTTVYGTLTAVLSGAATVTDERGRTLSYRVRATVTRVDTTKLSGSVALGALQPGDLVFFPDTYSFMAEGTFKIA